MPTEERDPAPPTRRIIVRRNRGAFSSGTSTRSESLRAPAQEVDEVDDAVDPEAMRDRIVNNAQAYNPAPPPQARPAAGAVGTDSDIPDPRARLNQVSMAGDSNYSREYRLSLLNRLLMRKVPLDLIAQQLQVSVSTVQKDRVELKKRLRQVARDLDINEIVGTGQEFYDEMAGMAMRIAGSNDTPTPMKLAAIRTTLAANADRSRFLAAAGVFDALQFRRADDGSGVSDVQMLMEETRNMFSRLLDEPDEPAPRPRQVRRVKRESFTPFSGDDQNDPEEMEI